MPSLRSIATILGTAMLCLLPTACNTPAKLARKAAAGDPVAQYRYAIIIIDDTHATQEAQQQAIQWLKESTAAGNSNAPALLALCYTTGKITPKNLNAAHHYLNIASDRDNYRAQLLLGHLHANGLGAPASPAKAVDQIRYAAMQGSPQAACLMFLCFYDGFGVRRNRQLALGWLQNAADFGSADAKNILKHTPHSPNFQKNVDLLRKKLDFFPKNH